MYSLLETALKAHIDLDLESKKRLVDKEHGLWSSTRTAFFFFFLTPCLLAL